MSGSGGQPIIRADGSVADVLVHLQQVQQGDDHGRGDGPVRGADLFLQPGHEVGPRRTVDRHETFDCYQPFPVSTT